jgi:septum formation protein
MTTTFILASGSPRRRELLGSLGISFIVIKSEIDETQHPDEPPLDYVRRLSVEKADAVAAMVSDSATILAADTVVILAADTIGVLDGAILGKPVDAADARAMLQELRDRTHIVCTALTLLHGGQHLTRLTQTLVTMRDYSDVEIEAYIATGDPFDKAGSYAIQHEGFHPVAKIEGSYTNVVGLPVETLQTMLDEIGWPQPP